MIKVEFQGDTFEDLLDQMTKFADRMGKRIGHSLFIDSLTVTDMCDLMEQYEIETYKDPNDIIERMTNGDRALTDLPIGRFGELYCELKDELDNQLLDNQWNLPAEARR